MDPRGDDGRGAGGRALTAPLLLCPQLEGEDEGVGIGAVLWSKPMSGLAVESRQMVAEQAEQIPAGGRAAGAWGLMDILGSWPVITGSDSVSVGVLPAALQPWQRVARKSAASL